MERAQFIHATASIDREAFLAHHLERSGEDLDAFADRFLLPPLLTTSYANGWGTLYTSVYRPLRGEVQLRWRTRRMVESFDHFRETGFDLKYSAPGLCEDP